MNGNISGLIFTSERGVKYSLYEGKRFLSRQSNNYIYIMVDEYDAFAPEYVDCVFGADELLTDHNKGVIELLKSVTRKFEDNHPDIVYIAKAYHEVHGFDDAI